MKKNTIKYPVFHHGTRTLESIGGSLSITSFWLDCKITDPQELLTEIFIYVLTIKEPSSEFHEQVNAIKTIIKYQTMFNETKEKWKYGDIKLKDDFLKYLLDDTVIGFSHSIVINSCKNLFSSLPNLSWQNIINKTFEENICEVASTKAVVHTIDRELINLKNTQRLKNRKNKLKVYWETIAEIEKSIDVKTEPEVGIEIKNIIKKIDTLEQKCLSSKSKYYRTKTRQKVWETLLDKIKEKKKTKKSFTIRN